MTRISDRIALKGGLLSNRKYHQQKDPNCIIWQQACSFYCRLLAAENDVSRREVIGCMRPLLRARDRIRGGLALD